MNFGFDGKLAIVTGASRGIGRGIAQSLAQEGCQVLLLARDVAAVESAAAELRAQGAKAHGLSVDLTQKDQVFKVMAQIREQHGNPDIFVYNNGGARDSFFEEATDDDYLHAIQIMIMGFAWCLQHLLPTMKQRRWGRIVTLGSICAKEPHRDYPAILHNLGRPAQVGMSKTLANQLGEFGITVNTIATGTIDHDGGSVRRSWAKAQAAGVTDEEIQQRRLRNVPMRRAGRLDEIGALCAFLCSEQAGYLTGQTIVLDGGRVATLM